MIDLRYALSEILKNGTSSEWWRNRFIAHVVGRYFRVRQRNPTPVIELDWDNLIILDACRYDLFEESLAENPLPGELTKRTTPASGTPDFLKLNFADQQLHDTVYVTANPYVNTELQEERFHAVEPVWHDGWNEELQTVLPDEMLNRTLQANRQYPDKRIISHFMQPHLPFIGAIRLGGRKTTVIRERALGHKETAPDERPPTPFDRLRSGDLSRMKVWEAYRSNLDAAMPAVHELMDTLVGKTAVTSDHGNAFGEFAWPFPIRIYGHPLGVLIPALTEVPWLVHAKGGRKTIRSEKPASVPNKDFDSQEERLKALGYVQ